MNAVRGTPSWLGGVNDRTAVSLLLERGELTKNQISELSGLSKPTASLIVGRLEAVGIIRAVGEVPGTRGPSAVSYAVRADRILGVAINISHLVMQSTVVDAYGTEHPVAETSLSAAASERSAVFDITAGIHSACVASNLSPDAVQMVCIGVQGSVDSRTDALNYVDLLPGWQRKGIKEHLEEALGLDVFMENDVNLAAIAEREYGAGADTASFALLWMGEGLGLAVDLNGSVLHGASGGAGEIGFLPTPHSAANFGSTAKNLQELVGGVGVSKVAKSHGLSKRGYQALFEALVDDPRGDAIFAELAPRIAVGIIPVLAVLDPARVVLGGPLGSAGGSRLAKLVQSAIRRDSVWVPEVVATTVPDRPVLRGAVTFLVAEVREALIKDVSSAAPKFTNHSTLHDHQHHPLQRK
ncbi:MAG: ROK family transcriptional regulator [Lacisediminihabitans sp.]